MDAIYGMTMETLAEATTEHGTLRTKFGEKQGTVAFEQWLNARGFTSQTWSMAYNAWHERWKADRTGMAEAQFHQLCAKLSQKAHFGDVRDMSQDAEHGVTLDKYAEIMANVARGGAGINDILGKFGVPNVETWQAAQAAWNKKMSEDTTHKLTMQYGELYAKHSGPSHQQEMLQATAAFLAQANGPQEVVDEPMEEITADLCLRKMESPKQLERWKYARHYAHMIDLNNVPDKQWAIAKVHPVLIESLERYDDHSVSDAEAASTKLWDIGCRDDDFKSAVRRCVNVAKDRLAVKQAAFAPIQDKAVPERIQLQQSIQDYQSLIETCTGYLDDDWGAGGDAPSFTSSPFAATQAVPAVNPYPQGSQHPGPWMNNQPGFPAQGSGGVSTAPHALVPGPSKSGSFPKWLIAPLALVLIGGIFFATRGRVMLANHKAHTAAASSAGAVSTNPTNAKVPTPPSPGAVKPSSAQPVTATPAVAADPTPTASSAAPVSSAPAAKGKTKKKK